MGNDYQIRHFGCDCGAEDCPTCHPENQEVVSCSHCGQEMRLYDAYRNQHSCEEYLCDECRDINYCLECEEYTWEEKCPFCGEETVEAYN